MKCPRCGSEQPEDSKFCAVCGLPLGSGRPNLRQEEERRKHNRNLIILIVVILAASVAAAGFAVRFLLEQRSGGEGGTFSLSDLNDWDELPEDVFIPETDTEDEGSSLSGSFGEVTPEDGREEEPVPTVRPTATPTPVPTYDPEEGGVHRYEYVVRDCTWREAFQEAKSKGGYLARINSREEYDAILAEINSRGLTEIHFRIGGRREAGSQEYYWVDENNQLYGEVVNASDYWCSTEWMSGEPSFQDGTTEEDCLDICYIQSDGKWYFNDVPDDILATVPYYSGKLGYIVEYED